jgi:hypothetical protein
MSTETPPSTQLIYEAEVETAERQELGPSPLGQRFQINILGGSFSGASPIGRPLRGRVLPGGADRQLLRPDGIRELDALYEMHADDGAIITVHNRVLIDETAQPERYARSVVKLTAPSDSPHAWMNRRVFVGTLQSLKPAKNAVCIRVYLLS